MRFQLVSSILDFWQNVSGCILDLKPFLYTWPSRDLRTRLGVSKKTRALCPLDSAGMPDSSGLLSLKRKEKYFSITVPILEFGIGLSTETSICTAQSWPRCKITLEDLLCQLSDGMSVQLFGVVIVKMRPALDCRRDVISTYSHTLITIYNAYYTTLLISRWPLSTTGSW